MKVTIINAPDDPYDIINEASAVCYARDTSLEDDEYKYKNAVSRFKAGHLSVFEHVNITFKLEGISRNCCTQLFRHRHMSVNQESQRYVNYKDLDEEDVESWCVIPDEVKKNKQLLRTYKAHAREALRAYKIMLNDGAKPEDARSLLPGGFKTTTIVTTNLRELFSIFDTRVSIRAQKEIRDLAMEMSAKLSEIDNYGSIIDMYWQDNHSRVEEILRKEAQ